MFKEFRQDTYFEVYGRFMFPEVGIDNSTPGKIVYKRDGRLNTLTLEIYGSLETDDFYGSYVEGRFKLHDIIGYTNEGMAVLIEGAKLGTSDIRDSKFSYLEYKLRNCLFLNLKIEDFEPIAKKLSDNGIYNMDVTSCQYSFAGIDNWIDESKVFCNYDLNNYTFGVDFDNIKEDYYLVEDENFKFSSGVEISSGENTFNEEFYWSLESIDESCFDIKSILDKVDRFKELLEILLSVPIDYSYLKFRIPIEEMENKLVTGYLVRNRIRVDEYKKFSTDIQYGKIKGNFEEILCNWFENINKLTVIVQNYIINKNALQYNQSILLNSIKSLEMYHRNFIQEREKERLKPYTKRNSEINFKDRLIDLFDNLNDEIRNKLIKNDDKSTDIANKEFATKLVETRNYYTHGDPKKLKESVIIDPIEIIETTLLLNQLIKYFVCSELFEVNEEIIDIITKGMSGVIK